MDCQICRKLITPLNEGTDGTICHFCEIKVVDYFNENIAHDEKSWLRYDCSIDAISDDEAQFGPLLDTIYAEQSEYWDTATETDCGEDLEDVIDYITKLLRKE